MYKRPGTLWIKVGTYLFEIDDRNYLIISDYFSRNPVVKELPTTTAGTVITATKESVSILDVPCEVVSDNGPQFFHRYDYFCSQWNIKHTTSSPLYPQSNGFIEKQIRYIKPIIKKCITLRGDVNRALLNVQSTPLDTVFQRPMTIYVPCRVQMAHDEYRSHLNQSVARERIYADQHTRERLHC